ncbi:MAG: nuclear transport factor 2 family protein [Pseudomonadota bacterium]
MELKKFFGFALLLNATTVLPLSAFADSDKNPVADTPTKAIQYLERFFEEDDVDAVLSLYREDSVYIFPPGSPPIQGLDAIRELVEVLEENGRNLKLSPRHIHQNGDMALVVVDWDMEMRGESGEYEEFVGTAVDVLKKSEDGSWYYYIDNPFGSAEAE